MLNLEHSQLEKIESLIKDFCTKPSIELLKKNEFVTNYPKNALIFKEGSQAQTVQFINKGFVKVYTQYGGKERIIRLADKGKIIGHRSFGSDNTYFASALTLSACQITSYPREIFEKVLLKNPKFCMQFLNFFAEELRISEKRIELLSALPVLNRIAYALVMNIEYFGFKDDDSSANKIINHTLSRKDLSGIALTTYESTIRSLSELEKKGMIKLNGKTFEIVNYQQLVNTTNLRTKK